MNRNKKIAQLHYEWRKEEAKRLNKEKKEKSNTEK